MLSGDAKIEYVAARTSLQPITVSRARTGLPSFQQNGSDSSAKVHRAALNLDRSKNHPYAKFNRSKVC
jgi:hypothetical protein